MNAVTVNAVSSTKQVLSETALKNLILNKLETVKKDISDFVNNEGNPFTAYKNMKTMFRHDLIFVVNNEERHVKLAMSSKLIDEVAYPVVEIFVSKEEHLVSEAGFVNSIHTPLTYESAGVVVVDGEGNIERPSRLNIAVCNAILALHK